MPINKSSVPNLHYTFIFGHVNNSYYLALKIWFILVYLKKIPLVGNEPFPSLGDFESIF